MRQYKLGNKTLALTVSEVGAQPISLRTQDGSEWIWQGAAPFWQQSAPHLFPFIGKHTFDCYEHAGAVYAARLHGFLHTCVLRCVHSTQDTLLLQLVSDEATKKNYPFDFCLEIAYAVKDRCVQISYTVQNKGEETMYFALGGHPGFCMPPDAATNFEDWELVFPHARQPRRMLISDDCFYSGYDEPYCLREGTRLSLDHDLFHREAVILSQTGGEVCLQSSKSGKAVTLRYRNFPFLAVWHTPHTQAPFVCLEPWTALPARKGVRETLSTQPFLTALPAGQTHCAAWELEIVP